MWSNVDTRNRGRLRDRVSIEKKYWNRGIGTSACKLCLNYIFNFLQGHRADANCFENNAASKKVLEKCGFKHEGDFKGYYKKNDSYIGRANYGIFSGEVDERYLLKLDEVFEVSKT